MSDSARIQRDRRKINVNVSSERRGGGRERRSCPQCKQPLTRSVRRVADGTVTTLTCQCGWSQKSRQTDADMLLARMSWELPVKAKAGGLVAEIPPEMADAFKLKAGDELQLSPQTLPVGSLSMKWGLTLKRKK